MALNLLAIFTFLISCCAPVTCRHYPHSYHRHTRVHETLQPVMSELLTPEQIQEVIAPELATPELTTSELAIPTTPAAAGLGNITGEEFALRSEGQMVDHSENGSTFVAKQLDLDNSSTLSKRRGKRTTLSSQAGKLESQMGQFSPALLTIFLMVPLVVICFYLFLQPVSDSYYNPRYEGGRSPIHGQRGKFVKGEGWVPEPGSVPASDWSLPSMAIRVSSQRQLADGREDLLSPEYPDGYSPAPSGMRLPAQYGYSASNQTSRAGSLRQLSHFTPRVQAQAPAQAPTPPLLDMSMVRQEAPKEDLRHAPMQSAHVADAGAWTGRGSRPSDAGVWTARFGPGDGAHTHGAATPLWTRPSIGGLGEPRHSWSSAESSNPSRLPSGVLNVPSGTTGNQYYRRS